MLKNNIYNIFVDTNVLIGAYLDKEKDKNCLSYLYSLTGKRLFISSLSVAQLVSVFQKKKSNNEIKTIAKQLLAKFTVLSFSDIDIRDAIALKGTDIEDNIQYVISKKHKCLRFITNNVKDYTNFVDIEVIIPQNIRLIKKN
jgi:predicted nucleic acid-binding protein